VNARHTDRLVRLADDFVRSGLVDTHHSAVLMLISALDDTQAAFRAISANDPTAVAGLEGKYYVRAAMHPSYAPPASRDELVRMILHGHPYDPAIDALSPGNRARLAVAVLAGWVQTHGDTVEASVVGSAWHRQIGDTAVKVSAA